MNIPSLSFSVIYESSWMVVYYECMICDLEADCLTTLFLSSDFDKNFMSSESKLCALKTSWGAFSMSR